MNDKTPSTDASAPIAIIGIGCMFPKAKDLRSYWQNILDGRDCITETPATHWKPEDYFDEDPSAPDKTYGRRGGFLDAVDFDPLEFGISPRNMEATDTTQLLGLAVAKEALKDAGYPADEAKFDKQKVSVVLGVTGTLEMVIPLGARLGHPIWRRALKDAGVDPDTSADVVKRIGDSYVGWQENSFPGLLGNVAAGRIANRLDLHGTNCVVDAACASSLSAMHLAMMELQTGRSDMVITGGVDTFNDIFMYMCFSKTPALSPTGNSKPFAKDGDGTILGEGLGVVTLKRLEDAERDGDRIYAVIRGLGSSSDGTGDAVYAPSSEGQARALRSAYKNADIDPGTVEMVEAHGTGTKVGDAVEVGGLKMVYGELDAGAKPWCALGSVKSMIGHTKAAAGAAGIIKAAMSLYKGTLPPTLKVDQPTDAAKPGTTPFYINTEKRPWIRSSNPRRAGVSAFGFGGSNFHCVLEEYQGAAETVDWDGRTQILAFSGVDRASLTEQIASAESIEDWRELRARAADSRKSFDASAACRLLLVIEERKPSARLLSTARKLLQSEKACNWSSPQGIYFGSGAKGKVAALFPGQGSQYPNMLRDLACQFPAARDALSAADGAFAGNRLSDTIYPHAAFDDSTRAQQTLDLRSTDVAQPAIGSVSIAALRVLESFGFTFDATAGHSYGELTALHAAGRLDADAFHSLSQLRGKLMAEGEGDRGSMIAVTADKQTIDAFVKKHGLDLIVANRNAPEQMVLSGATAEIDRAEQALQKDNLTCKRLVVAAAFHSPFVAEAAKPFAKAIADIKLGASDTPAFANTSGKSYPKQQKAAKKLLAEQLANPVEFVSMIENLHDEGITTFVEVGPSRQLSGLVQKILHDRAVTVTAIDASRGKNSGQSDLARTLAQLCAAGQPLDLGLWDEGAPRFEAPSGKKRLTVSVSGANLFQPKHAPATPAKPAPAAAPRPSTRPTPTPTHTAPSPVAPVSRSTVSRSTVSHSTVSRSHVATPAPTQTPMMAKTPEPAVASSTLDALLRLQEQTANLHRQFLDGQAMALGSIQALLTGQALPQQDAQQTAQASPEAPQVLHAQQALTASQAVTAPTIPAPAPAPTIKPPTPAATPSLAPQSAGSADVEGTLLAIVADKTGYPTEMLELSMGLDADLGIDSIKRVEILSALQEKLPTAPVIQPEHLGELQTLQQIVDFLSVGMPGMTVTAPATSAAAPAAPVADVEVSLLAIVADKTGYPTEMLELSMGLDADLGIDSIKRVEILSALQEALPAAPVIQPEHLGELQTLQHIVDFLSAGMPTTAVASPTASPTASAASHSGSSSADVETALLTIVADKTGYPTEMLELSMGLDADLGIDSIKRVEILSALQEALPAAPIIQPEHLGELQTLQDIVDFLSAGMADTSSPVAAATTATASADVEATLLTIVADKTGYPTEMLELSMGLDADLGIDSIKRVEILSALQEALPAAPIIQPEHLGELQTLQDIVDFLTAGAPVSNSTEAVAADASAAVMSKVPSTVARHVVQTEALTSPASQRLALAPGAKLWITEDRTGLAIELKTQLAAEGFKAQIVALDHKGKVPASLAGFVLVGDTDTTHAEIAAGFALAKRAGVVLQTQSAALFACVSRLDGAFGFDAPPADVLSGGLAGLAKTAQFEWESVTCKAIDLDARMTDMDKAAELLLGHCFGSAPIEIGISADAQVTLTLGLEDFDSSQSANVLFTENDTVVISGGARGVTAEIAAALASAGQPNLALLGRSAVPSEEAAWLADVSGDAAIKAAVLANTETKLKPKQVQAECHRILAEREIRTNLARIATAGSKVSYHPVDVRDLAAVTSTVQAIRAQHGSITGIIHGAGVLADSFICDKNLADFDRVYGTKVEGLDALLAAASGDALKGIVMFSSSTARFGRKGQVDYAIANEILNKTAQREAQRRSDCKVLSINWGPWDGGMVTPSLRKLFSQEGIEVIDLNAGAQYLLRELEAAEGPVETVILGTGSVLPKAITASPEPVTAPPAAISALPELPRVFERELDFESNPFLRSHVLDGKAVLPAAMVIEWLGHGALHGNPGLRFHGFEDLRIFKGVIIAPGSGMTIRVCADRATKKKKQFRVPVELCSGAADHKRTIHARATILLGAKLPAIEATADVPAVAPYSANLDEVYGKHLFHGPAFQGLQTIEGCSEEGIVATACPAPTPREWISSAPRSRWIADPLSIDCAFQMMILWSIDRDGTPSLPTQAQSYRQFQAEFPSDGVRIEVRVTKHEASKAIADIDWISREGKLVARMSGYECVIDSSLAKAFRDNQLSVTTAARR